MKLNRNAKAAKRILENCFDLLELVQKSRKTLMQIQAVVALTAHILKNWLEI